MSKKAGTRIRIESETVTKVSEPEDGTDVVMDQFAREFTAVLQLTREKQAKELTSDSFGGSVDDIVNARQEVAFFGDIAQKLVPVVGRLMQATSDQIHTTKKIELLLTFGDKFYHAQEFRAASMFFYENVLVLDEKMENTATDSTQQGVLSRILASTAPPPRKRSCEEGQAYVRSLFGVAMCCFHVQKRSDGFVRFPGKLEKMIEALTFLRLGMEIAVTMERQCSGQFSWLTLNGSVRIYSIVKSLQAFGFSREVVAYLKWSLLAMESTVALSTTTYIMWRLQLGSAICDCYEDLAWKETTKADQHLKSAVACAAYLQQIVQRLRKEEEMDMPLPVEVQRVLVQAETTSDMLAARVKAIAAHQPLTKSTIETTFTTVKDQICVAIDVVETLSRETKQKHGGQGAFALVPSASPPPTNESQLELFDFVMEIVTPILKPLVEIEESASTIASSVVDPAIFPLSLHMIIIRHCFQLVKPVDQMGLLIRSAQARIKSASERLVATDTTMVNCLLELYEALHEIQQSWVTWEVLSDEERLQSESKPHLHLPMSDGIIPASKFLTRLAKAMQDCVFHGDGAIARTHQELMTSTALQTWRELVAPLLKELDSVEPAQMSKSLVHLTCELLLPIHFTFTAVKFEDLLLHGQVCLRLATLLSAQGKARTGSQIVRQCLDRINSRRNELVNFSSHFQSVVGQNLGLESTTLLSNVSFSCAIDDPKNISIETINAQDVRDRVGIDGTGSQLGGFYQDLYCVQGDLLLLLYRLELQDSTIVDTLPLTNTKASNTTPGTSSQASTVLSATEAKLVEECHQNGYARALLNIQRLAHLHKFVKERRALADESIQLLQQMENQEKSLRRQLADSPPTETVAPAAPIVISRSSLSITVKVVEYHPSLSSLRKKRVLYYMVFAKTAGAGTAVSLNSNHLPGTATPVYPPHLHVTISGLLPNESYVFAVAAFDSKHELIYSIGETSEPVVALNPLPLPMCYGYLAKACYDTQLAVRANTAAKYLYNAVVSHACAGRPSWMANPFYRQALKRDAVAQFPIPILNLCIQALLILCHNEPGDLERDGKLVTSSDLDAQSLTAIQTKALEDGRKVSMAIEIACATDNLEAIRVLCFKGYRLLLPLLHLKGSCDGLTFAALVRYYQALHVIPSEQRDADTRNICARVGFELFRVAQDVNGDISRVTLPLVLAADPSHNENEQTHPDTIARNGKDNSLREVVALFKLASSQSSALSLEASTPAPPAAALASPRGAGAKGAAAVAKDKGQGNTPQATPRTADKAEPGGKLNTLNELLNSAGNDLARVFATLEQRSASDRRAIEFAAKICGAVLGSGTNEIAQMDKFLSSLKVAGAMGSHFRATLSSIGGGSFLPELTEADGADEAASLSSRAEQDTEDPDPLEISAQDMPTGADDDYLYRWCGELFFIQTVVLYRKITKHCNSNKTVDTANGPDTEDCTYELLHIDGNQKDDEAKQAKALESHTSPSNIVPHEGDEISPGDANHGDTSAAALEDNQLERLFDELLEKTAGCCKLFRLANCWQGLQAVVQQLWNAIWFVWVPPSRVSASPTGLTHLASCVDALLDMMDVAINGAENKNSITTAAPAKPSMALSSVVYTATNVLGVDQTWFARLMAFVLRALCSSKDWKSIVQKGSRYHFLCGNSAEGGRFSEQNFPVLMYAQQQILNHQESLLKAAEEDLRAYVTAFQEQEAKKKKKKSRLVVEEVLSPEEITFRANKQEMEQHIRELVTVRNFERKKLLDLSQIYDGLTKAINKSRQALHACHELVEKYRRLSQHITDDTMQELAAIRRQIIASYNRCVILSRQKRQNRIVCQALHEAGDFHLACGDLKAATKSWLESLDNAFSSLNVGASWREVLAPPADQFLEGIVKDKIAGEELWVGMQCCSVLAKLTMYSTAVNLHKAIDYALMAAAIFTRFYGCSVPHPTKSFLFGSYRMLGQFWPGRKLLTDPDRVSPFSLGIMLVLVPEILLQYDHQYASTAMPIIAGYEYVAESCLEDANHIANARRLRALALIQCGRFQEAFQVLMSLLRGGTTPRSSIGVPETDAVAFHDGKAILDEMNQAALNWLVSFNAEQTQAELKKHYHQALVPHISDTILHLAVSLARHENRYDRDAAVARSAAKKMAEAMLVAMRPSEDTGTPIQTPTSAADGEVGGKTSSAHIPQPLAWEELQLRRVRADIHLQLSYLTFCEGDWNTSKTSSLNAINEYNTIPLDDSLHLDLDQKLKFSLVFSRGTFLAKCRSQVVACCLAQTQYRAALETSQIAIDEAKSTDEEHLRQHLELQRLQAAVFLGEREKAERELLALRDDALSTHTSASLCYVHTLQLISSLYRSKALLSSQPTALNAVYERLSEAEQVLDALLEHDGWMGVDPDHSTTLPYLQKRLNLYRPAIPEFVQVHVDLAQVLLECPRIDDSESVDLRQEKAQRCVENGLRALEHTTQRMPATKARLQLLKGVLLSRSLGATAASPETSSLEHANLEQRFEECVDAFTECIKSSIEAGYDRQLVRLALVQLVDLFGQKLVPGNEDAHVQAAFHYLNLALEVQKHEAVVFDTLQLQNGTVTSVDKLPPSVCASINAQSEAIVSPPTNTKAPDISAIVNYFVRLLRMQHTLPASTTELQDTCVLLHTFLMQNHSVYARIACLTDLPPVPSSDPEIRAGMVCALWGQDLAPAIASKPTHDMLTLYFTLGTTKVPIAENLPAANGTAALDRVEKFASSPLLNKRCNLDRVSVQNLKTALSRLRTQMEDEDSLLIDSSSFSKVLHSTLGEIQQLFRGDGQRSLSYDRHHENIRAGDTSAGLLDSFGSTILIECTREMIRRLEDLFSINKGINVADNELCFFLRDLLD